MTDQKGKTVDSLLRDVPGIQVSGDPETRITSITFDSRQVVPGALFVALRGGYADGHEFLPQARQAGAVAAVVEPETPRSLVDEFDVVVRVPGTRATLPTIAARFYDHPSRALNVIGVTGTDGKTTTCWYVRQLLEYAGISCGLISTVAVQIPGQPDRSSARQTTPESLDVQRTLREMIDAGAAAAVVETTSHALELHRVDECSFDIGVVTNVTREHIDFHGSIENYLAAKGRLLKRVAQAKPDGKLGLVILNADDAGARSLVNDATGTEVLWYSASGNPEARVRAENVVNLADSSTFTLIMDAARHTVRLPLPGTWNVANYLAAASVAYAMGCDVDTIVSSTERLLAVPGRMELVDLGQPFTVLVDYAHTPESLRSVLTEVRQLATGRLLVVFGSAGERDVGKRALQGAVGNELADYCVFTSEDPRFEDPDAIISQIAGGAVEHGAVEGVDFDCIEDRSTAIRSIIARARPGDVVILAGKGHERSMIYGHEQRPWNEVDIARDALIALGYRTPEHEGTLA